MFTGIITGIAKLTRLEQQPGLSTLTFCLPKNLTDNLQTGASVAIDGTCLTVVNIDSYPKDNVEDNQVIFNVIDETLQKTTLGNIQVTDNVNVERSARLGDEIGGHWVSGHVQGKVEIIKIETFVNNYVLHFLIPHPWICYIFPKGYIALNGASLTIVDVNKSKNTFTVHLIPETLKRTTFSQKKVGDYVNFEVDHHTQIIVDTLYHTKLNADLWPILSDNNHKAHKY